jgi:Flp pilus assembly pilin Flp
VTRLAAKIRTFIAHDAGATLIEYGILILIIAALVLLTVSSIGNKLNAGFTSVNTVLP